MPQQTASATKANARQAVAQDMRAYDFGTTTSAGNAGGTTLVASAYIGDETDLHVNKWILITSGSNNGEFRQVSAFTNASGTFTVRNAFTAQVASAVTFQIYTFKPSDFTLAVNKATRNNPDSLFRPYYGYMIADAANNAARKTLGVPRDIVRAVRLFMEDRPSRVLEDFFNRANSTTSIGGEWTATTGTWGVTSERGYSVTDANADLITYDPGDLQDGTLEILLRGTLASATVYRVPVLCFRILEDYLGAIDTNNYLCLRLRATATNTGGAIDLRKVDGGTESSLTETAVTTSDGTDYVVRVRFEGNRIRVWVDDVELITYELQGLNLKYLEGVRVGVRWDTGGAPATAARFDNVRVHKIVPFREIHDWEQSSDLRTIRVPALGQHNLLLADRFCMIEGVAPLSLLAADTTAGALASDATAALEITTTEAAWRLLIALAKQEMYRSAAETGGTWDGEESDQALYAQKALEAAAEVSRLKATNAMPYPAPSIRRP